MFQSSRDYLLLLASCIIVPSLTHPNIQGNPNYDGRDTKEISNLAKHEEQLILGEEFRNQILSISHYDASTLTRKKRSAQVIGAAVLVGLRAIRNLFLGAKQIPSNSPARQYVKTGGYYRAFSDFKAANPRDVQVFTTQSKTVGRIGQVGDTQLILRYSGLDKDPTIEIRRMTESLPFGKYPNQATISGTLTDKITYLEF